MIRVCNRLTLPGVETTEWSNKKTGIPTAGAIGTGLGPGTANVIHNLPVESLITGAFE